jgi:hypothetical protein
MIETCDIDETCDELREEIRHDATLSFSIALIGADSNGAADETPMLVSHTCDVGAGGMALLIPSLPFLYRYLLNPDCTVRFTLHLPDGPINIEATPVYDRPLNDDDMNLGFIVNGRIEIEYTPRQYERYEKPVAQFGCLIGVRIKRISDADLERYMQYLEMIELQRSIMILTNEDDTDSVAGSVDVPPSVFAQTAARTHQRPQAEMQPRYL